MGQRFDWKVFSDINGALIFCFSEMLAIIPYLLRSYRIRKLYEAREIYWITDKMPKKKI